MVLYSAVVGYQRFGEGGILTQHYRA